MLTVKLTKRLTTNIMVDDAPIVTMNAEMANGDVNDNVYVNISDKAAYEKNKEEIREEIAKFHAAVYKMQDAGIVESQDTEEEKTSGEGE